MNQHLDPKLTFQQKSQKFPTFPHRNRKKQIPCLGSKSIPIHKLQINRLYNRSMDIQTFDRWAFVPSQTHKLSNDEADIKLLKPQNITKSQEKRTQLEFQSTSKLFLKRYLKRKDKKIRADTLYYSLTENQKNTFFQQRKSLGDQKITKSLIQLSHNPNKTQVRQNWPQLTIKGFAKNSKMYKRKQKSLTEQVHTDKCIYENYLSKYIQSSYSQQAQQQKSQVKEEIQKEEVKILKNLKLKLLQKRRRCIKNMIFTEANDDI